MPASAGNIIKLRQGTKVILVTLVAAAVAAVAALLRSKSLALFSDSFVILALVIRALEIKGPFQRERVIKQKKHKIKL